MNPNLIFKSTLGLLVLTTISVACDNGNCPNNSFAIGDNPIVFSSNIISSPMRAQDNAWETGDKIGLYMVASGKTITTASAAELYYSNVVYKTTQKGEKVTFEAASEADKMLFPTQGNKVDFVAFYPQSLAVSTAKSIELNTTTQPAADLLYTSNLKGADRTATVNNLMMNFAHMQATIRFSLQTPDGKAVDNATITLKGFKTKGVFLLADGTLQDLSNPADMLLIANGGRHDGIVLPQELASNTAQAVIFHGGKSYTWTIPAITFEPNKRVSYTLKLNAEGGVEVIGLGGTITDWTEVDGGSHIINPDDPNNETTLTLLPNTLSLPATGATATVNIATNAPSWSAAPTESWITATKENNTALKIVLANNTAAERNGSITVTAGKKSAVLAIRQAASTPSPTEWDGGIAALRAKYTNADVPISEDLTIQAIIISDPDNINSNKNMVVSDGKAGIQLRLNEAVSKSDFTHGDEVTINLKGTTISRYNGGGMQITGLAKSKLVKVAKEHTLVPIEVTFAELMSERSLDDLEGRLITLKDAQFAKHSVAFKLSKKTQYHTLMASEDAAGTLGYGFPSAGASGYAAFDFTLPNGNGNITGATMVSKNKEGFYNVSIWIRKADEVQFNNPRK